MVSCLGIIFHILVSTFLFSGQISKVGVKFIIWGSNFIILLAKFQTVESNFLFRGQILSLGVKFIIEGSHFI